MPGSTTGDIGALGPDLFRLAVEASPCGMVVVRGDGAIAIINSNVERLFGYRREELLGQPVEILLPEKLHGKHANQRHGFMHDPDVRHLGKRRDFFGRCKDGSEFPIEVGLNPMLFGEEVMVVCAIVDVSERKRLERLQDEFVTTVSHELRTPMTSIAGALGLMIGGAVGSLSPSAVHLIEIAHANCQRLVRLVNSILDMEKIESGKVVFVLKRIKVRALVEQAIETNRAFAEGFGVRLRLDATSEAGDLRGDSDWLLQVVTNLLSNAIKFSPPGEEVVVAIEKRRGMVRISVRDHGHGVPDAFKARIFGKFAQADVSDARQKGGTGLGLNIVKQIVTRLGGEVGFGDAPGGGAIFYADLPCWEQAIATTSEFDAPPIVPVLQLKTKLMCSND
jgi:PAS domain S-box-containing protein